MAQHPQRGSDSLDPQREDRIAVWRALMCAHDTLLKQFQAELKSEFDLSVAQFDALLRLTLAPGKRLRTGEIAEALIYSSGAATKVLDKLVERGLVERFADPRDRRTVTVALTIEGSALIDKARHAHWDSIHDRLGPFTSAQEYRHVAAFLKRIAAPKPETNDHPTG